MHRFCLYLAARGESCMSSLCAVAMGSDAATDRGPALALSPPAAVWQTWSRTPGAPAAVHPCATAGQPLEALGSQPGPLGKRSQERERWELRQRRQPQAPSQAELSQGQASTLPQLRCSTKLIFIITKVTGQWNPNRLFLVIETVS